MNIEQAINFMTEAAHQKGADQFDIYGGTSSSTSITTFEKSVQKVEISDSCGLGIRLFKNQRAGYAFTESFTEKSLAQTVQDAVEHAELSNPLLIELPSVAPAEFDDESWNEDLQKLSVDEMTQFCFEMDDFARQNSLISNVPYNGFSVSASENWFINSKGLRMSSKSNSIFAGIGALAKKIDSSTLAEQSKLGYYTQGGRDFKAFSALNIAEKAVERGIEMLDSKPIAGGVYPIVLSHRVSSQLFSMFMSAFFADQVQKGQSRLQDKLNTQIAVSDLTILHDPFLVNFPGSSYFDGDGVASQKFNLVENGVLNYYFYNLESAQKEGKTSNGCGSRGYSGKVGTTYNNILIQKGTQSSSELIAQPSECIYIQKFEGSTGCSAISGEISIGFQGFYVKNGVILHPVENITLSGNFFDLLMQIQGFSSEYSDSWSSFKTPDILIDGMKVST